MSLNLTCQFLKLLVHFRQHDLVAFADDHARLYAEAEEGGDYSECIAHYYSLMSKLIEEYFSGSFHFAPPLIPQSLSREAESESPAFLPLPSCKSRAAAVLDPHPAASIRQLHARIGDCLQLGPGKCCLDIGCGIGDVIEHLAPSGANFTGLTIAPNEVQIGNANFRSLGIHNQCKLVEANCSRVLPLASASQDAAYAIYALKYLPDLKPILGELARVVKSGGLLLVYDLLKTDSYDARNPVHRKLLNDLEFACGMPPLHTRQELLEEAAEAGFELVRAVDLDARANKPFHYCFSHSRTFMWMMRSPVIGHLIKVAQFLRILPQGFHRFNKIFLSGTVDKIVRAGEMGILSGAEILLFRLRNNDGKKGESEGVGGGEISS